MRGELGRKSAAAPCGRLAVEATDAERASCPSGCRQSESRNRFRAKLARGGARRRAALELRRHLRRAVFWVRPCSCRS